MIKVTIDSTLPDVDKAKIVNGEHLNAFVAVPDKDNKGYYALVFGELNTMDLCAMITTLRSTANALETQVLEDTKGNVAASIALVNTLQNPSEIDYVYRSRSGKQLCPKCSVPLLGTVDYKLKCTKCGYERKRK